MQRLLFYCQTLPVDQMETKYTGEETQRLWLNRGFNCRRNDKGTQIGSKEHNRFPDETVEALLSR